MGKANKYGLSRKIPEGVRRVVRQRSGYGCVICGSGIIQYEHVFPEFCDAKTHDPDAITLLCPSCHGKVTTNFWSKQKVIQAMKKPAAKAAGFTKDFFDFCGPHPVLRLGGITFKKCKIPIEIFDRAIIRVEPPQEPGSPFLLTATFCDSNGNITLEIIRNEWRASSELWDVEVGRGFITIRHGLGDIVLRLIVRPPGLVVVDRLFMKYGPVQLRANERTLNVQIPGMDLDMAQSITDDCPIGLSIYSFKKSVSRKLNIITQRLRLLQEPDPWDRKIL